MGDAFIVKRNTRTFIPNGKQTLACHLVILACKPIRRQRLQGHQPLFLVESMRPGAFAGRPQTLPSESFGIGKGSGTPPSCLFPMCEWPAENMLVRGNGRGLFDCLMKTSFLQERDAGSPITGGSPAPKRRFEWTIDITRQRQRPFGSGAGRFPETKSLSMLAGDQDRDSRSAASSFDRCTTPHPSTARSMSRLPPWCKIMA